MSFTGAVILLLLAETVWTVSVLKNHLQRQHQQQQGSNSNTLEGQVFASANRNNNKQEQPVYPPWLRIADDRLSLDALKIFAEYGDQARYMQPFSNNDKSSSTVQQREQPEVNTDQYLQQHQDGQPISETHQSDQPISESQQPSQLIRRSQQSSKPITEIQQSVQPIKMSTQHSDQPTIQSQHTDQPFIQFQQFIKLSQKSRAASLMQSDQQSTESYHQSTQSDHQAVQSDQHSNLPPTKDEEPSSQPHTSHVAHTTAQSFQLCTVRVATYVDHPGKCIMLGSGSLRGCQTDDRLVPYHRDCYHPSG